MRIILLQDIKGFGRKFDVKNVKDGYARNFLLPQNLAKIATERVIKELETQKAAWQKEEQEIKNKLETLAKEFSGQEFKFTLKTGKKGEVFGSVGKNDIKTLMAANIGTNFHEYLKDIEVNLERPIKKLGEHQVEIDLGKPARLNDISRSGGGVKTLIKVIIDPFDLAQGQS